ncbi:phosphate ABC transporter permease subunit PstC [Nitrospinota bacterium]
MTKSPTEVREWPDGSLISSDFSAEGSSSLKKVHRTSLTETLVEAFFKVNGYIAIALLGLIFIFLFKEGLKSLLEVSPGAFLGHWTLDFDDNEVFRYLWQPVGDEPKLSFIPLLAGSFLVAFPATLIASVVGVLSGIYLAELAPPDVREAVKPIIEFLAGIPSVVIGFLCLTAIATALQTVTGSHFRLNAFVAAIGVSVVVVPIITSLTEEAIRAVPDDLREAAYGLGATRWEVISRVLLPAGVSGISASIILGMGRALGETMIVLMASGNAALVTLNPFSSVRTMTATIAGELGAAAEGSLEYHVLFLVGAVLFSITFFLNLAAETVIGRMRKKLKL